MSNIHSMQNIDSEQVAVPYPALPPPNPPSENGSDLQRHSAYQSSLSNVESEYKNEQQHIKWRPENLDITYQVEDLNQQEAIIRMSDPKYLWQNVISAQLRVAAFLSLFISFILLVIPNEKTQLMNFDPASVYVQGLVWKDVQGNLLNTVLKYTTAVLAVLNLGLVLWKKSFDFQPVVAVLDLGMTGIMIWITSALAFISYQLGYKKLIDSPCFNLVLISFIFTIICLFLTLFCNFTKFIKRNTIEDNRRSVLEGKVKIDTESIRSEKFRENFSKTRTIGLYVRLATLLLVWALFSIVWAQRIVSRNAIKQTFLTITDYSAMFNLLVASGVVGTACVLIFALDFFGFTWIGGWFDMGSIATWIALLGQYACDPSINGIYKYEYTQNGPAPSVTDTALTFVIPYFTAYYRGIIALVVFVLLFHFTTFSCALRLGIARISRL